MGTINLKNNVYWIGAENPELRVFDIIMETKKGTTYNSYLIDDEKVAIIDTVKDGYFDMFIQNIKSIIGNRTVDYIIVQHTELDHSGSLGKLLQEYPEATVIASKAALIYSKKIVNKDFKFMEIPQELELGKTSLKFISVPNLHWPDTIFTYDVESEILFTCDVMGCHYCPEGCITDQHSDDYFEEMKYYFDVIMGPFKKFVTMGLDKIKNLELAMVAPSHGPVHVNDIEKYIDLYREWARVDKTVEKNVQIFYVSAYGNTENMAKYLADEIKNKGIKAEFHDISKLAMEEIVGLIEDCNGLIIGSPTINQDAVKPVWNVLSSVCVITNKRKAAAAFGSYGWSGEGVPMMTERLKSLKFNVVEPGFRFKFVPNKEDYKVADELVDKFVTMI